MEREQLQWATEELRKVQREAGIKKKCEAGVETAYLKERWRV